MLIYSQIEQLLQYAQSHLLLDDYDVVYTRNKLLTALKLEDYIEYEVDVDKIEEMTCPDDVLNPIVDYAINNGIITEDDREEFGDKIMDIVSLRPSQIVDMFENLHARNSAKAFDWLNDYGVKNDYIKATKIARNKHWEAKSTKGKLEITINLSKPEKSNKDTAKLLKTKSSSYPACMICRDNVGFAGHGVFRHAHTAGDGLVIHALVEQRSDGQPLGNIAYFLDGAYVLKKTIAVVNGFQVEYGFK